MKTNMAILAIALAFCLGSSSIAEPPAASDAANETMGNLTRSADQQLTASIQELNQLREQIAKEKLPMAQELTALEERLSQLRRQHDKVTRQVDEGNLGIAAIKAETKARQDELTYVGTLLDEYARTFETKVNISELQYCGEALESAKQATENTTLSLSEKFSRQVAFVHVSMKRLFDVIGGRDVAARLLEDAYRHGGERRAEIRERRASATTATGHGPHVTPPAAKA